MKAIEIQDILSYRYLSGLRFSPNKKRAAFVVASADKDNNCYEYRLWLYEHETVRQLTDLGKESQFIWIDDDRILFPAFRSAKEKKRHEAHEEFTPYYCLDLRGGEALPFFTLPFSVNEVRMLDSAHIAVIASTDKRYPDLWCSKEEDRKAIEKKRKEEEDYEVFDELPYWFNGAGITNGQRSQLFLITLEPFEVKPVTDIHRNVSSMTEHDGELFFASQESLLRPQILGFDIDAVNWKTGTIRRVFENTDMSIEGLETFNHSLLLSASRCDRFGLNENPWLYLLDPQSGSISLLREEEHSMYNSVGSDCRLGAGRQSVVCGSRMYHLTTRDGDCLLYCLEENGEDVPVIQKPGSIDCFDIGSEDALLIAMYDMKLQELYHVNLNTGDIRQISHFNDAAIDGHYVASPHPVAFRSRDTDLGGWVLLPKDFDPSRNYPAVFDIHGGPKTVYGSVFYHEMQVWAGMGYFVFFCNPTGSDGRDNTFMDIRGKYGTVDYEDLMTFADRVLELYPQIDPDHICVTGGSYGGFMTNWIIGHTNRFCCAASQRSISNWLSFWGTSDIGSYFAEDQNAGNLYESPQKLWKHSPLAYAGNVRTPTLFIHSDEDYRCPLEQGLQMYSSLVERGVDTRLCLFHGENHELSRSGKPVHRLRRLREITDWFERYARQ